MTMVLESQIIAAADDQARCGPNMRVMTFRRSGALVLVTVFFAALAGCSSGGGAATSPGGASAATMAPSRSTGGASSPADGATTAQQVVDAMRVGGLDCTGLALSTSTRNQSLGIRDEGTCSIGASELNVDVWTSNDARARALDGIRQLAGSQVVGGDRWSVATDTRALADRVQQAVGGHRL